MKNFGIKLFAFFVIALGAPVLLTAGILDLSPIVCNHKLLWIAAAPVFVIVAGFVILGKAGLAEPLFGKPDAYGKQKSFATIKAVAIAAFVAMLIQIWITSEC